MNILFSTTSDLSLPGAERTHILEVANNLARLGHKIHLIAQSKGDFELHPNIRFYKMFPFINRRGLSLTTFVLQRLHDRWLISKIIRNEKVDVIYERHGWDSALDAGLRRGIPVVLEINGVAAEEARLQGSSSEVIERSEKEEIRKLGKATRLIAVTDGIKDYYASKGIDRDKFAVIPNGVNTELFKPMDQKGCQRELGIGDYPLLCFVGSFRPYQGLEYSIKAMPLILKEVPDARLMLAGDSGEYHGFKFHPTIEELKELAKNEGVGERVIFTSKVEHKKISQYINASDVCLLLKHHRALGSSIKLFEYLACSKPVVGSMAEGVGDLLQKYNCGTVVQPEDPQETARAIVTLLQNESLRQEMGSRGRQAVVEAYSWGVVAKGIEAVLKELC